jgi:phosphatidylglycerol---prolipoprotein diacylglyceryl transferase
MLTHPQWDPIALSLGPLAIRWYGLSYVVAFGLFVYLGRTLVKRPVWQQRGWTARDVEDLIFVGILGVILGGRLGYVLFYKPGYYLTHPLDIFKVWEGGLAFHGGLLGVLAALAWFAWRRGRSFLEVGDLVAPCVPTGIASVRWFGNFVNGELWGRPADPSVPWAMVFPQSGTGELRHPSQLYQGALEGLLLFVILWLVARRDQPLGRVSGVFLLGYGVLRFFAEFFRQPDAYLGYLSLGMTMGQWLCVPMIVLGAWLIASAPAREATRKRPAGAMPKAG